MNFPVCVPVLFFLGSLFNLSLYPLCPRYVFKPKTEDHKVTGSKPVSASVISIDFPVPGVIRAKFQKVELWYNEKLSDDMPPRASQWNFLLENW